MTCRLCEAGFPRVKGIHLPSQRLGMISNTPCTDVTPEAFREMDVAIMVTYEEARLLLESERTPAWLDNATKRAMRNKEERMGWPKTL